MKLNEVINLLPKERQGSINNRANQILTDYQPGDEFQYGSPDDDLDAFIEGVDRSLEDRFGPDHQKILSNGTLIAEFTWSEFNLPIQEPVEDE